MESASALRHDDGLIMSSQAIRSHVWIVPSVLLLAGVGVALAYTVAPTDIRSTDGAPGTIVAGSCVLAATAIFARARRPRAWRNARWLGFGVLGLAALGVSFAIIDVRGTSPMQPSPLDIVFGAVAVLFLVPVVQEFRSHVDRDTRREIAADVALITAAVGTIVYLVIRPANADAGVSLAAAQLAASAAAAFCSYGALAMWLPSAPHVGMFAAVAGAASAVLTFAGDWVEGSFEPGRAEIDVPIALSSLFIALLITVVPRGVYEYAPERPTRYGRALLTTLSVTTACAALGFVATYEIEGHVGSVQASGLIAILAVGIGVRILVNQVRGTHSQRAVQDALEQKENALRETDKALARLQRANETLRESEERLRTVFEAAVDGIVELDDADVIVRANGAFCRMIELPQSLVEGQAWTALAASIDADESFGALSATGQGTLHREGHAVYVEARMSEIPGDPPRRLLLVRDVTPARVADQTIRSLFKFLQDRDEDRTRIMRRTNAAIESERNRIARDLHDGPVQGVSAASLSLEAVLLMLRAGETEDGVEVLSKVRRELSEEADNLRRLMSGLRPPLLEERGLIPALRETLDKHGRDTGVRAEFVGKEMADIPQDLETLAFRIVQEALSNSAKHAQPTSVTATVEAVAGQLRVEIADDGIGFDSTRAREYLQMGRVGLASMRERVELANGTFMVHSTIGKGTTVLATLPLDAVPGPREFSVGEAS
jgi:PAS domain S-box-containing protein